MRCLPLVLFCALLSFGETRSPDIPFKAQLIDGGASETAAVADVNRDGRLDIISGEHWYEAPRPGSAQATWTKHKFRELNYTSNYYDNFSDLPVDVDGDGYPDLVRVTWFAKKISWWKNPGAPKWKLSPTGKTGAGSPRSVFLGVTVGLGEPQWEESDIHTGFNIEFALLADMDNDGQANEIVAQENGTPQAWYEAKNGAWVA